MLSDTEVTVDCGLPGTSPNRYSQKFQKLRVYRLGYVNVSVRLKDVVKITVFWDVAPYSLVENGNV
jgi:hypothetical protein